MRLKSAPARLRASQRIALLDQLHTLLVAHLPILEALRVAGRVHPHGAARQVVDRWLASVQQGHGLAHGFRQLEPLFPKTATAMIQAGETTGTLTQAIADVASEQKAHHEATQRLTSALAYPVSVLMVAALVSFGLLLGVVPQFEALFDGLDAPMPGPTLAILSASNAVRSLGWSDWAWGMGSGLGMILAYRLSPRVRALGASLVDHAPVLGALLRAKSALTVTRSMGTLLRAGLPLAQALELVSQTTAHVAHRQALEDTHRHITQGGSLAQGLAQTAAFPEWMVHLVGIGEGSGRLDALFDQVASMLQSDVNNALDRSLALVEPIMMVTVGLLVGGLLIGLYLPIFNLSSVMM